MLILHIRSCAKMVILTSGENRFYVLLCGYHPFDMGDDEPHVIQVHTHTHTHIQTNLHTCTYMFTYVYVCIYIYVYV